MPLADITGHIQVDTLDGNDTLTLALAGGDFIVAGGLIYSGGNPAASPGDKLVITGGSQGIVTYNETNANDGSIVMSNFGTVTYTGLEPIVNSGTSTDIIFNLPAGSSEMTLGDDGTINTLSRLSSSPTSFERTDFANPTGSLTINRGNASDTITVNALPDFNADLSIGTTAGPFAAITLSGEVTLAAGKILSASGTNFNALASGAVTVSGAGAINLAADNVALDASATLNAAGTVSIVPVTTGRTINLGRVDYGRQRRVE